MIIHNLTKFHQNRLIRSWVIVFTDKVTDTQTHRQTKVITIPLHILCGGVMKVRKQSGVVVTFEADLPSAKMCINVQFVQWQQHLPTSFSQSIWSRALKGFHPVFTEAIMVFQDAAIQVLDILYFVLPLVTHNKGLSSLTSLDQINPTVIYTYILTHTRSKDNNKQRNSNKVLSFEIDLFVGNY